MAERVDKVTDPAVRRDLLLARRGQTYFSRKLKELVDAQFDEPSRRDGWTRGHVIARVGYHARGTARLVESAASGEDIPMFTSTAHFLDEIEFGATLTPFALRNLSDHAAVHLTVEWRDLDDDRWDAFVPVRPGELIPVARTPWLRAVEVWICAVDLGNSGDFAHFPAEMIDRLLREIPRSWAGGPEDPDAPPLKLLPTDREVGYCVRPPELGLAGRTLSGRASDLARWAAGRGCGGVAFEDDGIVPALLLWEE